jgi:pyrroline-5-carboxylate reductase
MAIQTVFGAAKMLKEMDTHPAILRDSVASPGGTTIHAIHELEDSGFRSSAIRAVEAATHRSKELSGNM